MNYQKIYNSIVLKARSEVRIKGTGIYYEQHHVKPKCLEGTNSSDNLVLLTGREHFICHRLLYKIYPDNLSIISAFWGMCNQQSKERKEAYITSSRVYEEARFAFSKAQSKAKLGSSNPMFGKEGPMKNKKHSKEAVKVMSLKRTGVESPRKGKPGKKLTEEQKQYLSAIHIGVPKTEQVRRNMSKPKAKTVCPHCGLEGGIGALKRYHFTNCKNI